MKFFLCGSAMEVVPVLSVDKLDIGKGKHGEITAMVHNIYIDAVRGMVKGYEKWLTPIYQ